MRRIISIAVVALLIPFVAALSQIAEDEHAKLESMLEEYLKAVDNLTISEKAAECDFLISSCSDSLVRQAVAIHLYDHFVSSKTMGEEALAVYLYDRWFVTGDVKMQSEIDRINAGIFADYNRPTLLGMDAPRLQMKDEAGGTVEIPVKGQICVLFFYDTECASCSMETIMLRNYLEMVDTDITLCAIYSGSNGESWSEYCTQNFRIDNPRVKVVNLWDPDLDSDFLRKYGILQTPRMFLIDQDGVVIGRRLTTDALKQLIEAGAVQDELNGRCPVGSKMPRVRVEGRFCTPSSSVRKACNLRSLSGNPLYVVFYSNGCGRCEEQLAAVERILASQRWTKFFLIDMDEVLTDSPETAKELFDTFDLSKMPFIIKLDRKGRVADRYVDLVEL